MAEHPTTVDEVLEEAIEEVEDRPGTVEAPAPQEPVPDEVPEVVEVASAEDEDEYAEEYAEESFEEASEDIEEDMSYYPPSSRTTEQVPSLPASVPVSAR